MAVTVLLTRATTQDISVVVSPLAEFSASLHVLTERSHHQPLASWADGIRAAAPRWFAPSLERYAPLWSAYRARFFYPTAATPEKSLDQELASVENMTMDQFAELAAFVCCGEHSGVNVARVLADTEQETELLRKARARSPERLELAQDLVADPDRFRADLLTFLHAARSVYFDSLWNSIHPTLVRERESLRSRLRAEGPASLAELSPMASVHTSPMRIVIDKTPYAVVDPARTGLLVIPSVYGWPHLLLKNEPGFPPALHWSVGTAIRASLTMTRERLVALSDPQRLTLCRMVAREPMTTSSLALRSGMSAPQVSRHLRRLRDLGLVTSMRDGHYVYYSLDAQTVQGIGSDLMMGFLSS